LWDITANCPKEYHSDFVHYYTDEGTKLIGNRVLSVICGELGINASEVKIENFVPEKYSNDNIGF
jgi:hypothetical protein